MIPCDPRLRWRLVRVAQGLEPPDLLIRGCRVWNAFTGEVAAGDITVVRDRVARVGPWEGPVDGRTSVLDARGLVAVPGYIEPHTHPWPFVNPLSLAEAAVCRGTTCLVYDNLLLYLILGHDRFARLAEAVSRRALGHVFWVARMASQSYFPGEDEVFSQEKISRLLREPAFLCTGEMTRWTDFLREDRSLRLAEVIESSRAVGRFSDGHTAGASGKRLPALAATGIRGCHEAITADEAAERLRQGLWVLLRNSSLRQDLEALLPVLDRTAFADRVSLTTDGAKAHHIASRGLTDHLIRIALDAGVAPSTAYRMATLNAATYLGLDADLGGIAPGRVAHVNLLRDLSEPTPEVVVCSGRVAARNGRLLIRPPSGSFDWAGHYGPATFPDLGWGPEVFPLSEEAPNPFPAGRLVNAVITREESVPLVRRGDGMWPAPPEALVLALTDRTGRWISRGVILGFAPGLRALASSYTTNAGILVLGTEPEAMAEALGELVELGGGIVVHGRDGSRRRFALPLAGIQMPGEFVPAAEAAAGFQHALERCGYAHTDPNYSLLFFSCDFLPDLRATRAGWIRVKSGEVLLPAQDLE